MTLSSGVKSPFVFDGGQGHLGSTDFLLLNVTRIHSYTHNILGMKWYHLTEVQESVFLMSKVTKHH